MKKFRISDEYLIKHGWVIDLGDEGEFVLEDRYYVYDDGVVLLKGMWREAGEDVAEEATIRIYGFDIDELEDDPDIIFYREWKNWDIVDYWAF